MDILETLRYLRPNETVVFPLGVEPTLSNVVWLTQRTYTSEKDVSKLNTIWNVDANVYTETPFTIPTQQECEDCWNSTLGSEIALKELRQERDRRLQAVDWVTSRATSTETPVPQEWKTYMQALRDLPATTEDPKDPEWPAVPA